MMGYTKSVLFLAFFLFPAYLCADPAQTPQKTLDKETQRVIFRDLVDLLAEAKAETQKITAPYGIGLQELQQQVSIKSVGEKLQFFIDAFGSAEDPLKAKNIKVTPLGDKDLDEKAARLIQRELNQYLEKLRKQLQDMAQKYELTLQEFRDRVSEKDVADLFDNLIDAIEFGKDGPKLEKKALEFQNLESIPWRIKIDEADDLYYKIKPFEVKYFEDLESLQRHQNALDEAEYRTKESEYRQKIQALKDKLKYDVGRYCEAFSQIDPYLRRRGQACGEKCEPIAACKEIGM